MAIDVLQPNAAHIVTAAKGKRPTEDKPTIFDIRHDKEELDLTEGIKRGLRPADGGEKSLPTLLLYDEAGLQLFEQITYLDEYYLTNVEIEVLTKYADAIAERISPNAIIVELGSGNLRKIKLLLDALEKAQKDVDYYALDLSLPELERTLAAIPTYRHVRCSGLHGTYDDGLEWLKSDAAAGRPKAILTMGSSIGNFRRPEAHAWLKQWADMLNTGDVVLIGIDACKDPKKVYDAYNDREGLTYRFDINGLIHANKILGYEAFKIDDWEAIGEFDEVEGRHHAFVAPIKDVTVDGVLIQKDERIRIEESYKWSVDETARMLNVAGLVEGSKWSNSTADYALHMAYKPSCHYPLKSDVYARTHIPSMEEWRQLWASWDTITLQMIPKEELLGKPIKLRNACIFYLGHIPTFLDIHLTRATKEPATEPSYYPQIFERGIDPDVENPELCHAHSEIPDEWPPFEEIAGFQKRVRERVAGLYQSGTATSDFAVRKALWLGFEHEVMHLETLLYMLVQSEKTLAPDGAATPDFASLAAEAQAKALPLEFFEIPAKTVTIGLDDKEDDIETDRFFGWDNEKPSRRAEVAAFAVAARPITNGEYFKYLEAIDSTKIPASWTKTRNSNGVNHEHQNGQQSNGMSNGTDVVASQGSTVTDKYVRTVFGPVPLQYALEWPVMASFDELAGCAKWMGGRIPSMEETRSLYEYVEEQKAKEFAQTLDARIPAVNGHLVNDGVEETPPSHSSLVNGGAVKGITNSDTSKTPTNSLFIDLSTANVGFKHWHPTPITGALTTATVDETGKKMKYQRRPAGQGETGGAWEWTSTVLHAHEGFEPMALYPGYTADFFDTKHNICLGGSWATHPRVAGRKSFVNWYQRNYPYVWATARIVKDL